MPGTPAATPDVIASPEPSDVLPTVCAVPSDLVPTARELLDALGSNTWTDGRADRLIETLGQSMGRATPAESREALAMLSSGLNSLEPEPAGVASRIVGAMIEAGHDPQPARAAMLGALQTTLPACASMVDEARAEVGEPDPELDLNDDAIDEWLADQHAHALNEVAGRRPAALEAWQRLHEIWPGAIALLSVDPAGPRRGERAGGGGREDRGGPRGGGLAARDAHRPRRGAVRRDRARDAHRDRRADERHRRELPAQHAAHGRVPARRAARLQGGRRRRARQRAAADRRDRHRRLEPLLLRRAAAAAASWPTPTDRDYADTWIWNEGMPADIPVLDGHRVILLGPASPERTWPAQRMFLKLPARLTAELLDESELDAWLATIEAASAKITR